MTNWCSQLGCGRRPREDSLVNRSSIRMPAGASSRYCIACMRERDCLCWIARLAPRVQCDPSSACRHRRGLHNSGKCRRRNDASTIGFVVARGPWRAPAGFLFHRACSRAEVEVVRVASAPKHLIDRQNACNGIPCDFVNGHALFAW